MREHAWTPDDTEQLDAHTARLEVWAMTAAQLLGDTMTSVPLRRECPSCGQLWAHKRQGAENIRCWALRASDAGAECLACGASWPTERYGLLAQLLNAQPQGDSHA